MWYIFNDHAAANVRIRDLSVETTTCDRLQTATSPIVRIFPCLTVIFNLSMSARQARKCDFWKPKTNRLCASNLSFPIVQTNYHGGDNAHWI